MIEIPIWILLLAAVFAVYRMAWSITLEDGPFSLYLLLRTVLGAYDYGERHGPDGKPMAKSAAGRAISCPGCVSQYCAVVALAMVLSGVFWLQVILVWWGVSGAFLYMVRMRPWRSL